MSAVGSTSSQCRVLLLLREPELVPISTPEENNKEDALDIKGDTQIRDLVNVTIMCLAKVNTLPKFRGETGKLKEFITKL